MPVVTKNLIIINVLLYLATIVAGGYGVDLERWLSLHFFLADDFHLWQLVTYMFMHGGVKHILFNMFAVWMFGRIIETSLGARRFIIYYMVCGIGAGLIQEAAQLAAYFIEGYSNCEFYPTAFGKVPMSQYLNLWRTVGASGAVYGILLAFGMMFPDERVFIFPIPIPIKAKFFVVGYAVIELLEGLSQRGDHVAHFAHLGGMLFGLLLLLHWMGRLAWLQHWHWPEWRMPGFRRKPRMTIREGGVPLTDDEEYNLRRRERQEAIDRILDKVRRSGYGSLTESEKRELFNAGR